jgi:hypothetical protein
VRERERERGIEREGERVREGERERTRKTRGDYVSYDTGTALRGWADINKVFKIHTVEPIRD